MLSMLGLGVNLNKNNLLVVLAGVTILLIFVPIFLLILLIFLRLNRNDNILSYIYIVTFVASISPFSITSSEEAMLELKRPKAQIISSEKSKSIKIINFDVS